MTRSKWSNFKLARLFAVLALSVFLMVATTGCNGGGSGGSGGGEMEEAATDLTGTWEVIATVNGSGSMDRFFIQLTQTGNNLTGDAEGDGITGTINGSVVTLSVNDDEATQIIGGLNPSNSDEMGGDWSDNDGDSGTWIARRTATP